MEFVRGTFQKLEAQTTVHLGRLEKNLSKGDIVEFDGFTLKFAGRDTTMPELKAGIKRGWLKLFEGESESTVEKVVQPPSPAKKKMKVETVYDEERTVATIKSAKSKKVAKVEEEPKVRFPLVIESADSDMIAVSKVESKSGAEVSSASSASDGGLATPQDAKSVGKIKIKTAAKQKTVISEGSQASSEVARLDNLSREAVASDVKSEAPDVEDLGLDEILDGVGGEETTSSREEQAKEAAQILAAVNGDVQPTQGAVTVGKDKSKVKALPVGIDWDMSPHWRKRASLALELYRDHPEILDAIKDVESKGVIKAINKGLEG
jgi:hypothetical protein